MTQEWTCPFCQRDQIVVPEQAHYSAGELRIARHKYNQTSKATLAVYSISAMGCANPKCREIQISFTLSGGANALTGTGGVRLVTNNHGQEFYRVRPAASYKPQPASVPQVLAEDYYEACKIRDLSPKASATLARRVIQGMIRDFCGISKNRLVDDIDELRTRVANGKAPVGVHPDSVESLHSVRKIGNIGAHMEKDINLIIDVDPNEAQTLIRLIEILFKDWYIARDERRNALAEVKAIADAKDAARAGGLSSPPAPTKP